MILQEAIGETLMNSPRIGLRVLWSTISVAVFLLASEPCRSQELQRHSGFTTIVKHYTCGHSARADYVITTQDQWEAVWSLAMSNVYPMPPAPDIDFSTQSVIAVFEGNEPSSDYSISIKKLIRTGKRLRVVVKETIPDSACKVLLVVTQPVHIIVTEKIPDPARVSFTLKQHITQCADPG